MELLFERNPHQLVNTVDAAELMGLYPGTLRSWRYRDQGPVFYRMGNSEHATCWYRVGALIKWLEDRKVVPKHTLTTDHHKTKI